MHAQAKPKRPDVNVNLKLHTFWECNASLGREVPLMFAALCRLDSGRYAPCVQLAMRSEDHERITPRDGVLVRPWGAQQILVGARPAAVPADVDDVVLNDWHVQHGCIRVTHQLP